MAETNRVNRELLKGGKKKKFDRHSLETNYRKGEQLFTTKTYDPNAIKIIRASINDRNRKEKVRIIIKLALSLLITVWLLALVAELVRRYSIPFFQIH